MSIQTNHEGPPNPHLEAVESWWPAPADVASPELDLTEHAWSRMCGRSLNKEAIETVMDWGRSQHAGGGRTRWRVDRGVIKLASKRGVDLAAFEGVVVIADRLGLVISVWRNRAGEHWRRKPATWRNRSRAARAAKRRTGWRP